MLLSNHKRRHSEYNNPIKIFAFLILIYYIYCQDKEHSTIIHITI